MSDKVLNWTEDKGDPLGIERYSYKAETYEIKILKRNSISKENNPIIKEQLGSFEIRFPVSYYLWRISKINELATLNLISGVYYSNNFTEFEFLEDFSEYPGNVIIDFDKPFIAIVNYPFHKEIEIKIPPLKVSILQYNNEVKHRNEFNIGYILWQISKAYKYIYKNKSKEVGVWGHIFTDLAFGKLVFYSDNVIKVDIDS